MSKGKHVRKRIYHGLTHHPLYPTWNGMMARCYNPRYIDYHKYGARGIDVYSPWRNDPKQFIDYIATLDHFGEEGRTIDRMDNELGYFPKNLRWATSSQQNTNKRISKRNKSGFIGVYFHKGRWMANVGMNGKLQHIGYYDSVYEAVEARNEYIINNNLNQKIQDYEREYA